MYRNMFHQNQEQNTFNYVIFDNENIKNVYTNLLYIQFEYCNLSIFLFKMLCILPRVNSMIMQ